jgi:hypothetical protein
MPIDSLHEKYEDALADWQHCRDVIEGQKAVHAAGERYLPRLTDQDDIAYAAYVGRALFFNGTQRAAEAFTGMVFRKAPVVEHPTALKPLVEDVTLENVPLAAFAQSVFSEVVDVGRVGVLVDFPRVGSMPRTVREAEQQGLRPFMAFYRAEAIRNWRSERINNVMQLTLVVLEERAAIPTDDYSDTAEPRLRALRLVNGVYTVEVFRPLRQGEQVNPENSAGGSPNWVLESAVTPMRGGAPMDFIPFIIFGPTDLGSDVEKPPMLDMVNVNLSHYRTTADLEHGAHFCGLPTPVVSGFQPRNPNEKLYIGSAAAWVFPQPDAKAYYLEFSGAGLSALESLRTDKMNMMAALGARMLVSDPKATETATTAMIHRAGEASILATMAGTVSRGLAKALEWMSDWAQASGECVVKLSTDYFPMPLDAPMLTALMAAWQQGGISKQTLFDNLKRGEIIPENRTFEEEDAAVGDEPPVLANQLTTIDAQAAAKPKPGQAGSGAK